VSEGSVTSPSGAPPSPGLSPYNLSMFANIPVLVIVSGVFSSSAPTAFSILCCCKSNLISSSEKPRICFLAQEDETGCIPLPGSETASR